jgi:hypothetical protein
MTFEIEEKTALEILNYLGERPFKEVFHLVAVLQKLKPIQENQPKSENKDIND